MSADADAGDAVKTKPGDDTPPQVDAEIVDAEFSDAEKPAQDQERPPGAAAAAPQKPGFPRKILIPAAFAVVLAVAAVIWLAWPRPTPPPASENAANTETPAPSPSVTAPKQQPEEPGEASPERPHAPDASKITNDIAAAKSGLAAVDGAPAQDARGLPEPPPPGGVNDSLQQAAKDAQTKFGAGDAPKTEAPPDIELKITPQQSAPSAPAIEDGFKRLQEEAETRAAEEEAGGLASADAALGAPPAGAASPKIGNALDAAALKQLFTAETNRLSSELSAERARSDTLARDVASLKERLNDAIAARRDPQTQNELDALKAEIEKIRSGREQAAAGKAAAASFALVGLQQKVDSGAPYEKELKLLEGFAPGAAGLESLRAHAATGAPTPGALKARFGQAIRQALVADREARAKGLWGAFAARFEGLVSVRPATPQPGDSARAVISRAEARLAADDLAGCVTELRQLNGAAREAMAAWLGDAEARVSVDAALSDLSTALAVQHQN